MPYREKTVLTAAQMRGLEKAAIDAGEVTGAQLMERAGKGVVAALLRQWPELQRLPQRACVLCGPGNNGGDGFVVARLLRARGWQVQVFSHGSLERLPADAAAQARAYLQAGGLVRPLTAEEMAAWGEGAAVSLWVDALFGTGLTRALPESIQVALGWIAAQQRAAGERRAKVVAVDIASGIDADSGKPLTMPPLQPDLTVCFHSLKLGHCLDWGGAHGGTLVVVDIGLAPTGPSAQEVQLVAADPSVVARLEKRIEWHKYTHGQALVLAGGMGQTGAARLAARAALRMGAGLVSLGAPPEAMPEIASQITSLMLCRVAEPADLEPLLEDTRLSVLCLGPGLGIARARALVPVALAPRNREIPRPVVLDADALTAFADSPDRLLRQLHENCVLTPHGGEFARLFPDIAKRLQAPARSSPAFAKVEAVRLAAARAGCVVLLKGWDTVIATPDGRCRLHAAHQGCASPWLATAGAGDVLAGFITGALARGIAPLPAAAIATWLHGACARAFGPGLIAEDLPEQLPRVLRRLLL